MTIVMTFAIVPLTDALTIFASNMLLIMASITSHLDSINGAQCVLKMETETCWTRDKLTLPKRSSPVSASQKTKATAQPQSAPQWMGTW